MSLLLLKTFGVAVATKQKLQILYKNLANIFFLI